MDGSPRQRKSKKSASTAKLSQPYPVIQAPVSRSSSSCGRSLAVLAVMISAFGVVLYLLPCPIDPIPVILSTPPALEGPLAPNKLLEQAERLFQGRVVGPEDIEMKDGVLYTGTGDGQIISIKEDNIATIARLGTPPCGLPKDEHTCGRPLGMRFFDGFLYVLDAYLGLYKVNVETGETQQLLSAKDPIAGKPLMFLNDLDIQSKGVMYFTDSSSRWHRRDNRYMVLENANDGRLLKYDPKTGETTVLIDDLCFANGVQLSPDEDFLLVAETVHARIKKYYLQGPKKGKVEIFADNIPGLVDNIRPRKAGGYWVTLSIARIGPVCLVDFVVARPWLSMLIAKFNPNHIVKLAPKYGLLIAMDQDGHIIQSLHDVTGRNIVSISSVYDTGEHLYLGSYYEKFIGRVNLSKV